MILGNLNQVQLNQSRHGIYLLIQKLVDLVPDHEKLHRQRDHKDHNDHQEDKYRKKRKSHP